MSARRGPSGRMDGVPIVSRWWRDHSAPQRIDLYTRVSYYVTLAALPPFVVLGIVVPQVAEVPGGAWLGGLVAAAALVSTVAAVLVVRACLDGVPERRPLAVLVPAAGVAVVAGLVLSRSDDTGVSTSWSVGMPCAAVLLALSVNRPAGLLTRWSAAVGVAAGAAVVVVTDRPVVVAVVQGLSVAVTVGALAAAFRFSVWVLEVVQEMDRTRGIETRLAVAEERLRFSRDLHDVMGRNLSAIAVKSQLAGALLRRGRPEAADELDAVALLAEQSLREVREVVRGYRATDLGGELAGARAVLRSAGVRCTVEGEDVVGTLAEPTQVVLGWVVREAVTNVLRHSRAGECTIAVTTGEEGTRLSVTNDGAAGSPARWGSGLLGLAERLAADGGTLSAQGHGPVFTVVAAVPS